LDVLGAPEIVPLLVADVFELSAAFRRAGDDLAKAVGQTQARWQVLSAASAGDKSVPQLARRLGYARQSVQRVVDLLVSEGVAEHVTNPDHKRSALVRLTGEGQRQLRKLTSAADQMHRQIAREVGRDDLATTLRVLRALRDAMRKRHE
jgi:DNA-binding MarR family transcriptional regulator